MILRTVARRVRALIRLATHSPLNYARGPHSSRANSRDDSHCGRAAPFSSRFPNMPRTISEHRVRWTRPCLDIVRSTWAPCTNTEKSPFCYMRGIANYRSVHCQYLSLLLLSALLASFQRVAWLWKNEHRYIPVGRINIRSHVSFRKQEQIAQLVSPRAICKTHVGHPLKTGAGAETFQLFALILTLVGG